MLGPKQGWLFFSMLLLHGLSDWAAVEVTGIFYKTTPFVPRFLEHDCFQVAFEATNSRLCSKYRQKYSRKI